MEIGRKIYFDKTTGEVIVDTGERKGSVRPTTVEQDIAVYVALSSRNRETFDVLELSYGQYAQDFREAIGYMVNPSSKVIEFSYNDPTNPNPVEPIYQKSLSEEVIRLKQEDLNNKEAIAELYMLSMGGF